MKTKNRELMNQAKDALSGKWGLAIGTSLVYILIIAVLQGAFTFLPTLGGTAFFPAFGGIFTLIIGGPLAIGFAMFILSISRNQSADIAQLFFGFQNFGTALAAYLLMVLFICLWSLLLIIPGIIMALAYSQTFFILADDNSIGAMDALRKSQKMMNGYKWKYFCLGLRFIGWALLCILTLGIGFLWLMPYIQVSFAKFYDDIKGANSQEATPPVMTV
jgi:uncharacterized membrane protein